MISSCGVILVRRAEMSGTAFESISKPYLIAHNQRKNLFVSYGVLIANNQEFLIVFDKLRYVLTEQGEGRVCHHDVCLFQKLNTFGTAKIAVAFKIMNADFFGVRDSVAVLIAEVFQPNRPLGIVLAEQVPFLILVAGGNQSFQAQVFKVVGEIVEKIGHARVIAVTENRLVLEVFLVMFQFVLDIRELCIELVFLGVLCAIQLAILRHGACSLELCPDSAQSAFTNKKGVKLNALIRSEVTTKYPIEISTNNSRPKTGDRKHDKCWMDCFVTLRFLAMTFLFAVSVVIRPNAL